MWWCLHWVVQGTTHAKYPLSWTAWPTHRYGKHLAGYWSLLFPELLVYPGSLVFPKLLVYPGSLVFPELLAYPGSLVFPELLVYPGSLVFLAYWCILSYCCFLGHWSLLALSTSCCEKQTWAMTVALLLLWLQLSPCYFFNFDFFFVTSLTQNILLFGFEYCCSPVTFMIKVFPLLLFD